MYVGRIHHGPNIIHSKKPIRSIEDFKDLKLRVPGGMIAEGFAAIGAKTTLLPGGEVFSALEKGTIEAADYTGPAVNWDLGFQQVTKYIWMGPVGLESIYQPVDLMDFCVGMNHWNKLSPKMKHWVELEIEAYSALHHAAIQKADMEAWPKFVKAGTEINRLPASDLEKFQRVAVPIWFKWANKDKDAARVFKAQLEVMESPTLRLRHARHVQGSEARPLKLRSGGADSLRRRSFRRRAASERCRSLSLKSETSAIRCGRGEFRGNQCPVFRLSCPIGSTGARSSSFRSSPSISSSASTGAAFRRGPSLFIAYLFWLCSGFMGLHRFYLRSDWGFIFIPVFLADPLHHGRHPRPARGCLAHARRGRAPRVSELDRAKISAGVTATPEMQRAPGQGRGGGSQGQGRFRGGASRSRRAGAAIRAGSRS